MLKSTKLSFTILDTNDCKTFGIIDTSYYSTNQLISNATIQILTPFSDVPVELDYQRGGVTIYNSNSLKITNVYNFDDLSVLPDGVYTAKMTICPEDKFYFEKSWYRVCELECKYYKAFLKVNPEACVACYDPEKIKKLQTSKFYINAIKANVNNDNIKEAQKFYKAADTILNKLLDCGC